MEGMPAVGSDYHECPLGGGGGRINCERTMGGLTAREEGVK